MAKKVTTVDQAISSPTKVVRDAAEMRAKYELGPSEEVAKEIRKRQQAAARAEERLGRKRVG